MIRLRVLGSLDLRRDDGPEIRSLLVQPKRVALLVYLAVALPRGFHRRGSLVALFWPELDTERARAALRNAIYQLRQALGADAIETRGAEEVRLAEGSCWCDALVFEAALAEGRLDDALALYRGDLLAGLFVEGAPDVEHWLDRERDRLREAAAHTGWTLAERELAAGATAAAVERARWAADRDPVSEANVRRLISMLDRAGDAAGALRVYDHFAAWLAVDLGVSPSAETEALVTEIRQRNAASRAHAIAAPTPEPGPQEVTSPVPRVPAAFPTSPSVGPSGRLPQRGWRRPRHWPVGIVAGLITGVALLGLIRREDAPAATHPSRAEAHPSTRSAAASAFFSEGLQAHYAGDVTAAERLYRAALREDSTFALAALYLASLRRPGYASLLEQAVRMADRWSPDRERLLARGSWAVEVDDPSAVAISDTLASRYPDEPDGQLLLGRALVQSGRFAAGAERLRRVLAMDTAGLRAPGARCRACEALPHLISAYVHLDSLDAAERVVHDWRRLKPRSAQPLIDLTNIRDAQGRHEEALAALREAAKLERIEPWLEVRPAESYMQAGDYAAADALLQTHVREGSPEHRYQALWYLIISLRHQGRYREALAAAERYHREFQREIPLATVLWDMGRLPEAAAAFHRIGFDVPPDATPSGRARWRAWNLTHRASILAELGDTAAVHALIDTIRVVGAGSAYGRDRKLHHHVRGLLWSAREQYDSAAAAFRRAQYSRVHGYNRVNLELARALVRSGRADEAIPVLRDALRTGVQSTGMYTTLPELHRALGDAWLAAGRPDSAAAHYRWTLAARRHADPELAPQLRQLRARLAALEGWPSGTSSTAKPRPRD